MAKGKIRKKRWRRDSVLSHPAFRLLVAFNIIGALFAAWLYFKQDVRFQPYSEELPLAFSGNPTISTSVAKIDSSQTAFRANGVKPASK